MEAVSARRWLMVAVSLAALVLVWPVLARVYGEAGDALTLSPLWLLAIVAAVAVQMLANWELHRLVLRTDNRFDIGASQLAGNAASHLLPGGNAIGAGVHIRMMTVAGFSVTRTVAALGAVGAVAQPGPSWQPGPPHPDPAAAAAAPGPRVRHWV